MFLKIKESTENKKNFIPQITEIHPIGAPIESVDISDLVDNDNIEVRLIAAITFIAYSEMALFESFLCCKFYAIFVSLYNFSLPFILETLLEISFLFL